MTQAVSSQSQAIRVLNDNFRTTFTGGEVFLTCGVAELPLDVKAQALLAVKTFDAFCKNNDPHNEHDFGDFEVEGNRFFWKIDYYDREKRFGSENPADPDQTVRVMTIMLAEEY
jgi:uncharacterized protein DUF3768